MDLILYLRAFLIPYYKGPDIGVILVTVPVSFEFE